MLPVQPSTQIYSSRPATPNPPTPMDADTMSTDTGGKPLYLCQPFIRAALVTGKFKSIVVLPKYVDVNEWVAINSTSSRRSTYRQRLISWRIVFDFYTNLNLFLAVLSESCTQGSCPTMSAGPGYVLP